MSRAKRFIPKNHELIQILHHAFVYNLSLMLLLIGDSKGTIIRGVWVSFEPPIFEAYRGFIEKCYNESLKWAYENENDEQEHPSLDQVRSALPSFIDFDSFQDYFNLWSCATNSSLLPIPPTEYIIPYHFSLWNKFKGGSDTLTKLFWNSNHYVPSDSPAAYAISRLIRLIATILYRCEAIMTSKENLSNYPSLVHWRNANNKRQSSFGCFLRDTARSYFFQIQSEQENPASPPRESTFSRASRNRTNQVKVSWVTEFTGRTPRKNVLQRYETKETSDVKVLERRERCTGQAVFRVGIDKDGKEVGSGEGTVNKCALCKRNTRWYCTQCHTWLCGPSTHNLNDDKKPCICVYTDTATGKVVRFRRSCFHMFHEQGLTKTKEDSVV